MKFIETNYIALKSEYSIYLDIAKGIGDNFGGPSLHFHQRALDEIERDFLGRTHIEMIYATLTSWGMHRMGDTKTKMVDFIKFENSILGHAKILSDLKTLKLEDVSKSDLQDIIKKLSLVCFALKTSESNSRIVGNSKTLAHILPDLVPPIDRQYTIRFFSYEPSSFFNKSEIIRQPPGIKTTEEEKWFSYIIEKTHDFTNHIHTDEQISLNKLFNTSYPKIFDNLIMAYVKKVGKKK
jgi:hypothetical protein